MSLPCDFIADLSKHFRGDIRTDAASRILYSTDASIYQIEPLGVAIPHTRDDLQVALELAAKYGVPVLARGAGTSLAGQAVGPALILDCSRWLDHLLDIDVEARTATVEPGMVLEDLNRIAATHGLQFGPDPASAERATIGGVVANNGTGAHSIRYGLAVDHIRSADVVLSDGSLARLGEIKVGEGGVTDSLSRDDERKGEDGSRPRYQEFLRTALEIRARLTIDEMRAKHPTTWRNSAGFRLGYLNAWSPSAPPEWVGGRYPANLAPGTINLAHLLAGSEGTLAVIRSVTLGLVPKPAFTILAIHAYQNLRAACDAVPSLLRHHPSAIELISRLLLDLARVAPASAGRMDWVPGNPEAVVVVEFSGDEMEALRQRAAALKPDALILESPEAQSDVWSVRKIGLGLLDSQPKPARPISFVEDCVVPIENLGAFVAGMQRIMQEYAAQGGIYGHASAGCLHIRPVLDLRQDAGRRALRGIADAAATLALSLGGSMTSEHGDGIVRGERIRVTYGEGFLAAMLAIKRAADPDNLLNPGKKLDAPALDSNLRYRMDGEQGAWDPRFDFRRQGGLALAIERCNGQGVCRKSSGVMCPSFQATREEMHSTRGRANLLRAMIATRPPLRRRPSNDRGLLDLSPRLASMTFEALDLCLACKGCKAECPSGVDMAALKAEFLGAYYESHRRPLRDYIFGYFHLTARLLSALAPLVNAFSSLPATASVAARIVGIAPQRPLPKFTQPRGHRPLASGQPDVLFLRDPFNHYIDTTVERAALDLLDAAAIKVSVLDAIGAGASLISKGFHHAARRHAERLVAEAGRLDPSGACPIVVLEPSELSALRNDYAALVPTLVEGPFGRRLDAAQSVEGYLARIVGQGRLRVAINPTSVLLHPHCHQKADNAAAGRDQSRDDLSLLFLRRLGFGVALTQAGCCGMAGTFGYEAEHYQLSQDVGKLQLFGEIGQRAGVSVAATGAACRMQIVQGTGVKAEHPVVIAARALGLGNYQ